MAVDLRPPRAFADRDTPAVRTWILPAAIVAVAFLVGATFLPPIAAGAVGVIAGLGFFARRFFVDSRLSLFLLLTVVLFVPIRTYAIESPLPFELEPYRVVILALIVVTGAILIADPGFHWRPMRFVIPMGVFLATIVISILVNAVSLAEAGLVGTSFSGLFNLLFILSTFFVVRQALRSERIVMGVLTFLAVGGGIVGFSALVERVTHVNLFLRFGEFLPLELLRTAEEDFRAGGNRSFGSAQHPIALAVLLCILIPIAVYLLRRGGWPRNAYTRGIFYGVIVLMMAGGILSAISRTGIVVLGVMFLLVLLLRPVIAATLALLALPLVVVGGLVFPKVVGSTLLVFLDLDSVIASQYTSAGWGGAGRLADLGPAFEKVQQTPFFGTGFGSRIVIGDEANSFILDNQVLAILMESGALGVLGFAIFILTPILVLLRHSLLRNVRREHRDLAFAIAVSATGYATALFFYDAFGFMQTLLVLCILLAVGAWLLTEAPRLEVPEPPTAAPQPAASDPAEAT
jgi:O-antigen ligase